MFKLPHLAVDAVKSNIVESRISTSGKGCSTIARSKKYRGGSRTLTTCKKELFVTLIQDRQPLANITKDYMLDVVRVLDLPLE